MSRGEGHRRGRPGAPEIFPTITASDSGRGQGNGKNNPRSPNLQTHIHRMMFPTPAATQRPNEGKVVAYRKMVLDGAMTKEEADSILGQDVFGAQGKVPAVDPGRGDGKLWATPQHHDAAGSAGPGRAGVWTPRGRGLQLQGRGPRCSWGRPEEDSDPTGTERAGTNPETGKGGGLSRHVKDEAGIPAASRKWPTPIANDAEKESDRTRTTPERPGYAQAGPPSGQLNPDWVDVLMGYPTGTTELVPEAVPWLRVDSKRLKAADLKKLHALDEDGPRGVDAAGRWCRPCSGQGPRSMPKSANSACAVCGGDMGGRRAGAKICAKPKCVRERNRLKAASHGRGRGGRRPGGLQAVRRRAQDQPAPQEILLGRVRPGQRAGRQGQEAGMTRSEIMSRIRSKGTKPELAVQQAACRLGLAHVRNAKALPGCPDLYLPDLDIAVFMDGCFWRRPSPATTGAPRPTGPSGTPR